ncbi:uncharacterized protein LOC114328664 [Diabrotica virgifera virgifera]|uniref:Uncharacterized protein LOC114328664 n=1 Tax=Diabrotica virgifera virgifera TaxID=50390 RepID=A0A6P7FEW3_DIAVI|nr:uncharacterized protein LOC114328664 [Diabrotica virgifera virgifera]
MKTVLYLSCLISLVFVHSEVINPQSKNYTIIDYASSYSIPVWYVYSSKVSFTSSILYQKGQKQHEDMIYCTKFNTSQLCSCLKTYLGNPDTAHFRKPVQDKQVAVVDMAQSVIRLNSGTVCNYHKGKCQDPKINSSVGVCWEYKKHKIHTQRYMVEEYNINSNTFLVFDYEGTRTTLQLLYFNKNSSLIWCTNRLDMVVFKGSYEDFENYSIANTSRRNFKCFPKKLVSNDRNTESKSENNNIDTGTMYERINSQKFQQLSESFWVIKFVCVPVIVALILLHMILSCLQFKTLNELKNGNNVKQAKISENSNRKVNKNQTNTKEAYYESVDYDAINRTKK